LTLLKICIVVLSGILAGGGFAIFAHKKKFAVQDNILGYIGMTFEGVLVGLGIVGWIFG
jgi:hypothetical protein